MNRLQQIAQLGQSLWYDNIRRGILESGELARLIDQGITGVTSNPTIFEKAINGSHDYDADIRALVKQGLTVDAIYDHLVLEDIGRGADLLRPIYDQTAGVDGYISIEVPPTLAQDTQKTIDEAHRLYQALNRPNIMIKVPATPEGIPAIETLIRDGIPVNVTLIFSLNAYRAVMEAYIRGLEARLEQGLPVNGVASVASFFVSRVDTLIDQLIQTHGLNPEWQGRAAIANAKLAYRLFQETFAGPRWDRLKNAGARVQRPLWASTSTKNPAYPDLLYVEALIGPDTVDTLPPATVDAILDHGQAARTVDQNVDEARQFIETLEKAGISMDAVTDQLLAEGVQSFNQSFVTLMQSLTRKRVRVLQESAPAHFHLGTYEDTVEHTVDTWQSQKAVERIWQKDWTLWSQDPEDRPSIENGLGWLQVMGAVTADFPRLLADTRQLAGEGFTDAVVLGMGGSSLIADVWSHTYSLGVPGLRVTVLDTTNPSAIEALDNRLNLRHTLFIVASKSGTTTEPLAFYRYYWNRVKEAGLPPGPHFVAITDPGTPLAEEAAAQGFRALYLNPADIGGRYSALSWFGMVPAAYMGMPLADLMPAAEVTAEACQNPRLTENPGAYLGAVLGALAKAGRDKVTFILPDAIASLADWLEQLLAESTGKRQTGLIPIAHEPVRDPSEYAGDRVFVVYRLGQAGPADAWRDGILSHGHPLIELTIPDLSTFFSEFFRWEMATAVAGAVLGINAFDQPNVQESKENTKAILAHLATEGQSLLPRRESGRVWFETGPGLDASNLPDALARLLHQAKPQAYLALMAYLPPTDEIRAALQSWRDLLGRQTGLATTLGFGPRFLHSTGQLHKGGPHNGLFLQLVAADGPRLPIPTFDTDFLTLMQAQALGDFRSLVAHGRTVIRVALPAPFLPALADLTDALARQ
ncbi:transaldolase [Sulfobacillus acidophilus TPY]|uniref:Transaldolase n=1 Tax=Sulfobacillus acidophilus (strain ATCC 700253 / DSM 10332 / NAL) TaxID=679936 RepID=G8TWS0_SULAD|nr:transaldolase [Sulfobacillus acidophilus TPY]AEW06059.1 transaldolase, glucose-6-phosphate isomerase [Sulfobacillus acidophilus DSM 10332]